MNKVKVSLELAKMSVMKMVAFGNHVVTNIGTSSYFATPYPALSVVSSAVSSLQTLAEEAKGGGTAKTAAVKVQRDVVENLLVQLGHYVEGIANDSADSITAELIVLTAGMNVKRNTPRQKQVFTVEAVSVGKVKLTAKRVVNGTHEWEYTTTPNVAASWIDADLGTKSVITLSGLTSGTRYYFRHRAVQKNGPTNWDEPYSTIIL